MTTEEITFFDTIASSWDDIEIKSLPPVVSSILDCIGIKPGDSILDLGTGTGVLLPYLSQRIGENGSVTAVDISTGMLGRAKAKYSDLHNVTFRLLDFEKQLIEDCFDLIILYCVYPHIEDPISTLLKLIDNNLNDHGRIIIAFPCDEAFINSIHSDKDADAKQLPSAPCLSSFLTRSGIQNQVLAYGSDRYIIEIKA